MHERDQSSAPHQRAVATKRAWVAPRGVYVGHIQPALHRKLQTRKGRVRGFDVKTLGGQALGDETSYVEVVFYHNNGGHRGRLFPLRFDMWP